LTFIYCLTAVPRGKIPRSRCAGKEELLFHFPLQPPSFMSQKEGMGKEKGMGCKDKEEERMKSRTY